MKLRAPNFAEVASTKTLMLARGTGGAYAAGVVAGKDIVNALTTKGGRVAEGDRSTKSAASDGTDLGHRKRIGVWDARSGILDRDTCPVAVRQATRALSPDDAPR